MASVAKCVLINRSPVMSLKFLLQESEENTFTEEDKLKKINK